MIGNMSKEGYTSEGWDDGSNWPKRKAVVFKRYQKITLHTMSAFHLCLTTYCAYPAVHLLLLKGFTSEVSLIGTICISEIYSLWLRDTKNEGHHNSVESSAPSMLYLLRHWVWIPSTADMLFHDLFDWCYYCLMRLSLNCEIGQKFENKTKLVK